MVADGDDDTGGTGGNAGSGTDGADAGPCGMDCSTIETPPCLMAVCNTGQVAGTFHACVVVPSPKGAACDDGQFCTTEDACDEGRCVGGPQNVCGIIPAECSVVVCFEETRSCKVTNGDENSSCTPADLCKIEGVCHAGDCVGKPKDCSTSPLNECNTVACDPSTGDCSATADASRDDAPCQLSGNRCNVNKTCKVGQCTGGAPKDCSALDDQCHLGVCDGTTGDCGPTNRAAGTPCVGDFAECRVGECGANGQCGPVTASDGAACNDHDACTTTDTCEAGVCSGESIVGCAVYLKEGFESCPHGWTFGGDWHCGMPTIVGPPAAHSGSGVIATNLAGRYSVNQSFDVAVADSSAIDLSLAMGPILSFWAWEDTEGGTHDGWNVKVSTNGGASFTLVAGVKPAYGLTILGQPAWGGDHSAQGWQHHTADLSGYAGHSVILRFALRSDSATVFPGVYIDDIVVAESQKQPLFITTPSALADVYAGMTFSAQIEKAGGTGGAVWSIESGGVNADWLSIDPATGLLEGTPSAAGLVSVTVRVQEPTLPSNFAQKTFAFKVKRDAYFTSFEGACPAGWTVTGDWQCGVPKNVGRATALAGTQCLAAQIVGNYSDLQTWTGTTVTSPDIDLTDVSSASLSFRM